jgi:hypothetical protein
MFVEGYVDGKLKVDFVLVESTRYMQSKGLLLAKALVNVKDEEKCSFYKSIPRIPARSSILVTIKSCSRENFPNFILAFIFPLILNSVNTRCQ